MPTKVVGGGVKGKFMWLEFETGSTMWITLGMSGYWSTEADKHAHFGIGLDNDRGLYFVDQRRFGTIKFSHDRAELEKKLKSLGMDPLNDPSYSLIELTAKILRHYDKPVRSARQCGNSRTDARRPNNALGAGTTEVNNRD